MPYHVAHQGHAPRSRVLWSCSPAPFRRVCAAPALARMVISVGANRYVQELAHGSTAICVYDRVRLVRYVSVSANRNGVGSFGCAYPMQLHGISKAECSRLATRTHYRLGSPCRGHWCLYRRSIPTDITNRLAIIQIMHQSPVGGRLDSINNM